MTARRKKNGRGRKRKPVVTKNSTNKVDARLAVLLGLGIRKLRALKKREEAAYQEQRRLLRERLATQRADQKDEADSRSFELPDGVGTPLTFGLYFPDQSPKEVRTYTALKEPFVSATIKAEASAADLKKLGVHVRNQAGNVFTAFVPFKRIKSLAKNPAIEHIELARPLESNLGQGIPYAQIDTLHGAASPVTGNGVIVGISDSTLDVYHVDFRNNDGVGGDGQGSSRVLFLWIQYLGANAGESGPPVAPALPGFNPVGGSSYGVEYSQANINAELNNYQPGANPGDPPITAPYQVVRHGGSTSAHGTHVAGCGTGNGRGASVGAAPGSALIYVARAGDDNYVKSDSSFMLDAFAYVFARATALGQPCVTNMSSSDNMGPHDGSTNGELFLDNLLSVTGRAITLAAGNTDNKNSHTSGNVAAGGTTTITVTYVAADSDGDGTTDEPSNNDEIEIWYDGHDRFGATVTVPTGVPNTVGPVAAGSSSTINLPTGHTVQVVHGLNDPRNGDNVITVFISGVSSANPIPPGAWSIALTGTTVINGSFAAWVDRNNRAFRSWAAPVTNNMTIASPATSLRSIAVGSHDVTAPQPSIAASSSAGPTRDSRVKPDISANGLSVTAARSRNMALAAPGALTSVKSGTSMAAPIVAGACALLFECRGAGLSWSDLKQILWNNAGAPAAGIPSNKFGFGFLQMANACSSAAPDIDVWARDHATDTVGAEPFLGAIAYRSPDIEVLDMLGGPVANPTYDPANFVNNIVRVTARNQGSQDAHNVQVFLYWADPATNIPYPSEWQPSAIYTGDPNFVVESNVIVIPTLAAGTSTAVRFAWAPPAPGSNIRGDDHFCLIVRLEAEGDPSNVSAGGWDVIRGSNNIVLRNTHVQAVAGGGDGDGDADTAFFVTGGDAEDRLEITWEDLVGAVELAIPVEALPWRIATLGGALAARRDGYGSVCNDVAKRLGGKLALKGRRVTAVTGIEGADRVTVRGDIAYVRGNSERPLVLPEVRVMPGVKMPVRLAASRLRLRPRKPGFVNVRQLCGGRPIGGVSLEVRRRLPKKRRIRTTLVDGKLVIDR